MKTSRLTVAIIAIAVVAIALLTILAVGLLLPGSSVKSTTTRFSLPGTLETAPANATNPNGCGTNYTDFVSLPAHSRISYYVTVNQSEDSVNYWVLGNGPASGETTVSYGSTSTGSLELGAAGTTLEFVFQGCGPTSPVPYGFWGNYTLGSST